MDETTTEKKRRKCDKKETDVKCPKEDCQPVRKSSRLTKQIKSEPEIEEEKIVDRKPRKTTTKTKQEKGLKKEKETDCRKSNQVKDAKDQFVNKTDHEVMKDPTRGTSKYIGAHVSIAGGLHKSVLEAVAIGASAFGMFLKSQRTWNSKPLEDKDAQLFKDTVQKHGYSPDMIVPHGSYLMNCGSPNPESLQKSRDALVEELQRCEKLGLTIFNFHPGSSCGTISMEQCIQNIADSINQAHTKTKYVITVIENMCCQGNTIGGKFEDLRAIIDLIHNKARIGVCLDTCHAFAAGYDLSTECGFENMVKEFESIVGFKYLKAMHINDSKGKLGCHLDRHENIGQGFIKNEGFQRIMKHPKFDNIPMILETPCAQDDTYIREINKLYNMCKK